MPGKMTVLDRLIKEGKIKPRLGSTEMQEGFVRDPLNFPIKTHKAIREYEGPRANKILSMTPEREVYQQGIEARMQPKYLKADENVNETYENMDAFKDEWNESVAQAKEDMLSDWQDELENAATDEPYGYSLEVEPQSTDLRDYWPDYGRGPDEIINDFDAAQDRYFSARDERNYLRTPGAWMQEQTMTPRYRNYQRAMQQRAANMAMGRDLSRRYAIAYNNLLRRGLAPAEARMYMREYFGGR
jgi:hypothetical protein